MRPHLASLRGLLVVVQRAAVLALPVQRVSVQRERVGVGPGAGRRLVGLLSRAALLETFALPSLRRQDGHFTCRDAHAPWTQVLRPPRPPGPPRSLWPAGAGKR